MKFSGEKYIDLIKAESEVFGMLWQEGWVFKTALLQVAAWDNYFAAAAE